MNPFRTLDFILRHPLNRGHAARALTRYACWQAESRLKPDVVFDWVGGAKLVVSRGMTGATGNIYCGLHEYEDMSFILHALLADDVFVDVGANIGSYTILASAVCRARTIAIEPDPATVTHLARNIAANGLETRVDIHATAVGEETGSISFTVGQGAMNRVARKSESNVQSVALTRLDDLLERIDPTLIKMDVEGYEGKVLQGAEQTLAKPSLLAILLETAEPSARHILERHGFQQFSYSPQKRSLLAPGEAAGSNILFIRDYAAVSQRIQASPRRQFRGQTL